MKRTLATAAAVCLVSSTAHAILQVTPEGQALGLSLRTFATGFPTFQFPSNNIVGPTGITFPATGGVLVTDATGKVRRFATDTNGQLAANAPVGQDYTQDTWGMTRSGNNCYLAGATTLVQVNDNGALVQPILDGFNNARGLVTDPRDGKLFMAAGTGAGNGTIWNIDPIAKTKVAFKTGLTGADGLSISPDGHTVYVAAGTVHGFDTTTGAEVFNSGAITVNGATPFVDGIAVGTGSVANRLFVNLGSGAVVQVDLATKAQTVIASGGSRGDFVSVDPYNDTLLITQQNSIMRLVGAAFSDPPLIPGDANRDRAVNFDDLLVLAQHYGTPTGAYWSIGDFNTDDAVSFDDLLILAQHYGVAPAAFQADWAMAQSLVPEPVTAGGLALAGTMATRRRRRARL